jgi:hypothetical protein
LWTRDVQNVVFSILFCGWLGGMGGASKPAEPGKLLTIEEVGEILNGKLKVISFEPVLTVQQFQSTSKIETPSISPSRSTSIPLSLSSKNLHDLPSILSP